MDREGTLLGMRAIHGPHTHACPLAGELIPTLSPARCRILASHARPCRSYHLHGAAFRLAESAQPGSDYMQVKKEIYARLARPGVGPEIQAAIKAVLQGRKGWPNGV